MTLTTPNYLISATSRQSKKTVEEIELVFGTEASIGLSYTVLKGNSCISVLPSWTFAQTLNLKKFATLHVDRLRCYQLRWTCENWLAQKCLNRRGTIIGLLNMALLCTLSRLTAWAFPAALKPSIIPAVSCKSWSRVGQRQRENKVCQLFFSRRFHVNAHALKEYFNIQYRHRRLWDVTDKTVFVFASGAATWQIGLNIRVFYDSGSFAPLYGNVTLYTKPEVYIAYCIAVKGGPSHHHREHNNLNLDVGLCDGFWDMRADRQTDTRIAILYAPLQTAYSPNAFWFKFRRISRP